MMFTERAIGRNFEQRSYCLIRIGGELRHLNARFVTKDFFRILQLLASNHDFYFRSPLAAGWKERFQVRRSRKCRENRCANGPEEKNANSPAQVHESIKRS